ncbi:hypothetical protein PIB30_052158 [Stylosanthes scabra]|uniref:Uncharacterized protein n=1 Tax=Stylosanthes scabra TaxID=79078 RepID=A0ABU6ZGX8_9FABA|nr:hypothetical protein [Stylosanthes scabra]
MYLSHRRLRYTLQTASRRRGGRQMAAVRKTDGSVEVSDGSQKSASRVRERLAVASDDTYLCQHERSTCGGSGSVGVMGLGSAWKNRKKRYMSFELGELSGGFCSSWYMRALPIRRYGAGEYCSIEPLFHITAKVFSIDSYKEAEGENLSCLGLGADEGREKRKKKQRMVDWSKACAMRNKKD